MSQNFKSLAKTIKHPLFNLLTHFMKLALRAFVVMFNTFEAKVMTFLRCMEFRKIKYFNSVSQKI